MSGSRSSLLRNIYLATASFVVLFAVMTSFILWLVLEAAGSVSGTVAIVTSAAVILVIGLFVSLFAVNWFIRHVVRPNTNAAMIAGRVATGDLTVGSVTTDTEVQSDLGRAVDKMVEELRGLVSTLLNNAQDASTMAQQISSATEEMSASTEEVSGTCNDLTERATQQAALVRSAAADASRILSIAEALAGSANRTAERNAALVALAREHRTQLDTSSAELVRLEEEIRKGAEESEALARASTEIEEFVDQTKAIARQTHILSINAGIEASRAGEEARGFAVVAEEVKKLAGQAGEAANATSVTVRMVQERVRAARDRLLRLSRGGQLARETAHTAADGLAKVVEQAEENDAWTRQISQSAGEVRSLIGTIAERIGEISTGTEDVAAAAQEIAASTEELSASTEEIAASSQQMAGAAERLSATVSRFQLGGAKADATPPPRADPMPQPVKP
jgi:methyl-accepting chemotaxis protein